MKKIKSIKIFWAFIGLTILIFNDGCSSKQEKQNYQAILKNGDLSLTILTNAGGRIVSLHNKGGKSIIYSDTLLWDTSILFSDEKYESPIFVGISGHINWVGPQSDWWTQQNHLKDLKEKEAIWPPDPYLIYGDYKIIEQTESSIKMVGPPSLYSGVQLTKYYSLNKDNSVDIKTEMKNIRDETVSWDLWFNTRMDGNYHVYVPIKSEEDIRLEYRESPFQEPMAYEVLDGFFFFTPGKPSEGMREKVAKSFIYPSINQIYSFTSSEMLIIEFERHSKELIHKEQSLIEIYNSFKDDGTALLELEYHTPYYKLEPGESVSGKEKWYVIPYQGDDSCISQIEFIKTWSNGKY